MFKSSIKKNNQNIVLDHVIEQILTSESPFGIAFQTFTGKKARNEYVENQIRIYQTKRNKFWF